jgi:hypothetical protein
MPTGTPISVRSDAGVQGRGWLAVGHGYAAHAEFQVPHQAADVGAVRGISSATERVDGGASEIGPEGAVAAGEVVDVKAQIHRVRIPCDEDDGRLGLGCALEFDEHSLFAGLDELEIAQAECIALDHSEDEAVGGGSRLDSVDGGVQGAAEGRDGAETGKAGLIEIARHRQGESSMLQIGTRI